MYSLHCCILNSVRDVRKAGCLILILTHMLSLLNKFNKEINEKMEFGTHKKQSHCSSRIELQLSRKL